MKKAKTTIFFLIASFTWRLLYADVPIPLEEKIDLEPHEDESIVIERMIQLTEEQQAAQIKLKFLINEIKHNQKLFLKGDQTKLHAHYMIEAAKESLQIIKKYHLQHLFSSDFMEDLALFSQIGTKEKPSL